MAELNGTFIWCMMNDSTHSLSSWAHKINSLSPRLPRHLDADM